MKKKRTLPDVGVAVAVLSLIMGTSYGIYAKVAADARIRNDALNPYLHPNQVELNQLPAIDSATIPAR